MNDLEGIILSDLADTFGSDKGIRHPQALNYMPLYARYFAAHNLSRTTVRRVLEIGTNTGASVRMWAEYFTNAEVHGLDITRRFEIETRLRHPRIKTHMVDQGNRKNLGEFMKQFALGTFDLIVDDGSHEQSDQQVSLGVLFQYLKPDGLYVIEDLITGQNWWDSNTYNKHRVTPTRDLMMQLEEHQKNAKLVGSAMTQDEIRFLLSSMNYCDFRTSNTIIYQRHHPEIAFIGRV